MSKVPENSTRYVAEKGVEFVEIYISEGRVEKIVSTYTGEITRESMLIKNSIKVAFRAFLRINPKDFLEIYNLLENDESDICFQSMKEILLSKNRSYRYGVTV